jgi:hypothetical protein
MFELASCCMMLCTAAAFFEAQDIVSAFLVAHLLICCAHAVIAFLPCGLFPQI